MKERVFLMMSKNGKKVAEHDITNVSHKELLELVEIQKEFGRSCCVKRVVYNEEAKCTK